MKRHGHKAHGKSAGRRAPSSFASSEEAQPARDRRVAHREFHPIWERSSPEQNPAEASADSVDLAPDLLQYGVSIAILLLGMLAVVFALYFAEEIFLPLVVAVMIRLLLAPAQRFLTDRARLPSWAAAIVLVLALIGGISLVAGAVAIPATQWIQKAPQTIPIIKEKIAVLRQPIGYLQEGLRELEGAATSAEQETVVP
jgi:hypothetical protein